MAESGWVKVPKTHRRLGEAKCYSAPYSNTARESESHDNIEGA
jgi:hypothetical protein